MVDGPPSDIPINVRLERLRERRRRWRNFEWTAIKSFKGTSVSNDALEVRHTMAGNVLVIYRLGFRHLHFVQVPSVVRGLSLWEWDVKFGQTEASTFIFNIASDPYQDLLVTAEGSQRCVTPPHKWDAPPVSFPLISSLRRRGEYKFHYAVENLQQPFGFVAATTWDPYVPYCVELEDRSKATSGPSSFAFISEQYMLLIRGNDTSPRVLRIVDICSGSTPSVCILHLPAQIPTNASLDVQTSQHSSHSSVVTGESVPFVMSSTATLASLSFSWNDSHGYSKSWLFIAPRFLNSIDKMKLQGNGNMAIPWDDWGPHNTTLVEFTPGGIGFSVPVINLCGTKALVKQSGQLRLHDFSQNPIANESSTSTDSSANDLGAISSRPQSINYNVTMNCPCRIASVPTMPPDMKARFVPSAYLSDDGVVVVKKHNNGHYIFDVYSI
ncbi:hypothetical protein AX17_003907 [Amanita inopinata Kibby_2008]|nr:hypothetical protein AX17_003907 [Amanita inopinata Kibby_2008]